jgi:hypothetical protein
MGNATIQPVGTPKVAVNIATPHNPKTIHRPHWRRNRAGSNSGSNVDQAINVLDPQQISNRISSGKLAMVPILSGRTFSWLFDGTATISCRFPSSTSTASRILPRSFQGVKSVALFSPTHFISAPSSVEAEARDATWSR